MRGVLHWVLPVFRAEIRRLHGSVVADVFWLHRTLDVVDTGDSRLVGAVLLGLFIGVSIVADQWDYTQLDRAPDGGASVPERVRSLRLVETLASLGGVGTGALFVGYAPQLRSGRGLFLGVGTALVLAGLYGLTTEATFRLRAERRWARRLLAGSHVAVSFGGAMGGLALLASPLGAGLSTVSAGHAGLGALILLQTTLLARGYVATRSRPDGESPRPGAA